MHLPRKTPNYCFVFSNKESLAIGTELLVFRKDVFAHIISQYSLLTNTWSTGMQMNVPRCFFGKSLGEIAIFSGGCDLQGKIHSSAELYDSETATWRTLRSMNKPRSEAQSRVQILSRVFRQSSQSSVDREGCSRPSRFGILITARASVRVVTAPNLKNGIPATSAAPPLVAAVNNQFTLLTMQKCWLGSMKSITKKGFIEVNSW
ncbi:putative transcription factor-like [Capsicum annuum]|uniref:F-box/kelch-repeat protein n=1 Tax=Capsicum annuum TaxID=4072 RepID=A0A2G2YE61_CAPAN|nr:putative transcription factor-like [Capsicum annuum]KAF3656158.1 putative transcription factor-like [Capsicum annuum]PHT67851.1 hypothetical protein T459_27338 [Capsicum annuum]